MKKSYQLLALCVLLAGCTMMYRHLHTTPTLPGAPASEEDREVRKKWEKRMFADPATGAIPEGIRLREQAFARNLTDQLGAAKGTTADWQVRGPWNVGGRTRALAIDVTNENRMLAGGVSSGVWLSENGGQTWSRKTPLDVHPGCVSIAQDPRPGQTNTWYYLSGEIIGTSASGGGAFYLGDGMFKSTDGGNTWAVLGATDNGNPNTFTEVWQSGWRVVVHPVTGDVYASVYSTIYKSTNGGTSWTIALGGVNVTPLSYFTDLAVTSTGVMYAYFSSEGNRKGMWRSTDGTTWTLVSGTSLPTEHNRMVIGINPNNENEVYLFGDTPGAGLATFYISDTDYTSLFKYTYVSGDGSGAGGSWNDLSLNLPQAGTQFDSCAVQGGYDLCVKVQPGNSNNIFIGGTNLWRSTDGFTTPNNNTKIGGYKIGTQLPFFEIYPNHHPDQHDVLFLPSNPNIMLSASDGGIHRTDNCLAPFVNWTSLNNGYHTTQFYTVVMERATAGDPFLIGGLQDNGNFFTNSSSPQAVWKQTVNGDGAFGAVPDGKPFAVLSIQQGRVVKCNIGNDGTVQAFQRFDPVGREKEDYLFINPLSLDHADQNILYLPAGNQFYRQSDLASIPLNGAWEPTTAGWTKFPDTIKVDEAFTAIGVSKSGPAHRVYLGTSDNQIFRIDNAHTGAPAMTKLTSPLVNPAAGTTFPYVSCIAVDPDDANKVVLAFSNYGIYSIFSSTDGGTTWIKVAGNLENNITGTGNAPSVRWINILTGPGGARRYYAGTSVGMYSTSELKLHATGQAGTGWTPEGATTIGNVPVPYIESRPSDGLVVAATHGHGMFSANVQLDVATEQPGHQLVVHVFPNPATDWVRFDVSAAAQCRIYDALGRLVRNVTLSPQQNTVDMRELQSGVYYYEVVVRGKRGTGKVVRL